MGLPQVEPGDEVESAQRRVARPAGMPSIILARNGSRFRERLIGGPRRSFGRSGAGHVEFEGDLVAEFSGEVLAQPLLDPRLHLPDALFAHAEALTQGR